MLTVTNLNLLFTPRMPTMSNEQFRQAIAGMNIEQLNETSNVLQRQLEQVRERLEMARMEIQRREQLQSENDRFRVRMQPISDALRALSEEHSFLGPSSNRRLSIVLRKTK
jgi:predicted nuclease with TOPRIM domain